MNFDAVVWASKQTPACSGAKLVLIGLASYADEGGVCSPGQALLAQFAMITDRSVRSHLTTLEEQGYITRTPRYRDDGGRLSDYYRLNMHTRKAGG